MVFIHITIDCYQNVSHDSFSYFYCFYRCFSFPSSCTWQTWWFIDKTISETNHGLCLCSFIWLYYKVWININLFCYLHCPSYLILFYLIFLILSYFSYSILLFLFYLILFYFLFYLFFCYTFRIKFCRVYVYYFIFLLSTFLFYCVLVKQFIYFIIFLIFVIFIIIIIIFLSLIE